MTLEDLQGNILVGYGSDHAHYVFARIEDPDAARRWLRDHLARIRYNESWGAAKPDHTFNIAFTHAGLRTLGVPSECMDELAAFAAGMEARGAILGDEGPSAPQQWIAGMRGTHLVIVLTAWRASALHALLAEIGEGLVAPGNGLRLTYAQAAATLPDAREHFGFKDGFSQPAVEGASTGPRSGEGVRRRFGPWRRWRDLAVGEFVLGYRDEGGMPAPRPAGPLGQDSSFMVLRKLEQHVGAFRTYVSEQAELAGEQPARIAAKMVGRWQNGSSLVPYPLEPGPEAGDSRDDANRFGYAEDADGKRCPLGAHVRRAHPRDGLGWESRLTLRHRMLRRGMSYGPVLPAGTLEDDGRERGLMFVCYQASIERQFEFVQKQWLGDGNVFGLGSDRDPIVAGAPTIASAAQATAEMVIQGDRPVFLSGLPRFVTMRGGDYFLVPGRVGLQALADGTA